MSLALPLRDDFDSATLRRLARTCLDNRQIRRLLALAAAYDGMNRTEAARIGGMDRQTLRDWVHRFNNDGPDGLTNAKVTSVNVSLGDRSYPVHIGQNLLARGDLVLPALVGDQVAIITNTTIAQQKLIT